MTSLPLLKKEKATSVKSLIHFVIFTVSNPKPTPTPTPTPNPNPVLSPSTIYGLKQVLPDTESASSIILEFPIPRIVRNKLAVYKLPSL